MKLLKKYDTYIMFIIITLAVGFTSCLISGDNMGVFNALKKPPLSPPGYVFPIVWTILYTLMAISSAMIYESNSKDKNKALAIYIIQLFVNFFWSILFFKFQAYLFSFIWLLLLLGLIVLMISKFFKINKTSAYLLIPYLLWVTFAGYLNVMIYILNT